MGKRYTVFCAHRVTDDNFMDVIEFVPIFVIIVRCTLSEEGLKFRATWNSLIKCLCREEALLVKEIRVVWICSV